MKSCSIPLSSTCSYPTRSPANQAIPSSFFIKYSSNLLHLKQKKRQLLASCIRYGVDEGYPLENLDMQGRTRPRKAVKPKMDTFEYEALIKGGEQVTSVLEEIIGLLEDVNMDEASEEVAVQLAAQGVIWKRVDELESSFMMALDYMIQIAEGDQDDKRKALLDVIKETVLSHLTEKGPPHVQVVGLLCSSPLKESRHELLRRVAADGGVFKSKDGTKVHTPGGNLNDIANQADDLLEMNFLTKLVALKPGKAILEMIRKVMLGKDKGADNSSGDEEETASVQRASNGIKGRESVTGCKPLPVRPRMFLETVAKVLGDIYAGNGSRVTAQHLEWVLSTLLPFVVAATAIAASAWSPNFICLSLLSQFSTSSRCSTSRNSRSINNGALSMFACSTLPFIGTVGPRKRHENFSLLSFGSNSNAATGAGDGDSSQVLSALLPFVVAATAISALAWPSTFTWVSKDLYAPALGGIMLSIGIKLSINDFALAIKRPLPLSIGFIAQYALKPALGVLIARAFGISPMFYSGFLLTACVGGAQLSSYASFLSKGDVALSILLTSFTTISSVFLTPLLSGILIGSVVPVDAVAMSKSILQVVLVPVTLGLVLNSYAKPIVTILQPVMPFVAMICTSLCIGSPLAINRSQILSIEGVRLVFPVLAFHTMAFTFGYWASKIPILRQEEEVSRTISLCTGMQSSTLAGLLATQFLGSTQAVPPACSVVAMAIMGLCLASFWGGGSRIRDIPSLLIQKTNSIVKAS